MGLKSNISNEPEAVELREKLMDAVGSAECDDEQVLHELTAALACSAVYSKLWSKEETLEAVAILYDVATDVEQVKILNPFVGPDLVSPPEA